MVPDRTWLKKMYAATSRFEPPQKAPHPEKIIAVDGAAEIGYHGGQLKHLYQHDPVRVVFPTPPDGDIPQAIVVTTSGGLTGGDRISVSIDLEDEARALIAAQAAEKLYKSSGLDTEIQVALKAGEDCWLEYLPQETILFDSARLNRNTRIEVDRSAKVLAGEMLVFGRLGSGEVFTKGYLREDWTIYRDGRLAWADALLLDDDVTAPLHHPAGFDGATAMATAVYAGPDAETYLDDVRELLADEKPGLRAGVSLVNGLLVMRWLARDPAMLRQSFGNCWQNFRAAAGGLPARMPRLWEI
jgi:urease accessory protein